MCVTSACHHVRVTHPAPPVLFSRPYRSARELANLTAVLESDHVHGDGPFTTSAGGKVKAITEAGDVLLTSSGTDALEMAARLLDLGPGDEVILPSFTFPSAAVSVALSGATCVFVDVDPHTGNIDPEQVAEAVGPATRAISVMHYGGVGVPLADLESVAEEHGLAIIEDNAHGLGGRLDGRSLGSVGRFGIQSFHDTKNVHSGEGGALLVNDRADLARAEILREKGTNRSQYIRGQVDKYTWVDIGSSYLISELGSAVLDSQLDDFDTIQSLRHSVWRRYSEGLAGWADDHGVELMSPPPGAEHTAHLFYLLLPTHEQQMALIERLRAAGVMATFHYMPLDVSPAGERYGRRLRPLVHATSFAERLVRLPLWAGMTDEQVERVIREVTAVGIAVG